MTVCTPTGPRLLRSPLCTAMLAAILVLIPVAHSLGADNGAVSRARMAIDAGNRGSAVTMLEQRVEAEPTDAEARFLLARVLSWLERWPESLQHYDLLLADSPDNVDYLHGKAQVLVWSGRPEQALPLLERARALAPEYESIWQLESQALLAAGGGHAPGAGDDAACRGSPPVPGQRMAALGRRRATHR